MSKTKGKDKSNHAYTFQITSKDSHAIFNRLQNLCCKLEKDTQNLKSVQVSINHKDWKLGSGRQNDNIVQIGSRSDDVLSSIQCQNSELQNRIEILENILTFNSTKNIKEYTSEQVFERCAWLLEANHSALECIEETLSEYGYSNDAAKPITTLDDALEKALEKLDVGEIPENDSDEVRPAEASNNRNDDSNDIHKYAVDFSHDAEDPSPHLNTNHQQAMQDSPECSDHPPEQLLSPNKSTTSEDLDNPKTPTLAGVLLSKRTQDILTCNTRAQIPAATCRTLPTSPVPEKTDHQQLQSKDLGNESGQFEDKPTLFTVNNEDGDITIEGLDFATGVSLILPESSPDAPNESQVSPGQRNAMESPPLPPNSYVPTPPLQDETANGRSHLMHIGSSSSSSLETPKPNWKTPLKTPMDGLGSDAPLQNQTNQCRYSSDDSISSPVLPGSPLRRNTLSCVESTLQKSYRDNANGEPENVNVNGEPEDILEAIKYSRRMSLPKTPMIRCTGDSNMSIAQSPDEGIPSLSCSPPKTQAIMEAGPNDSPTALFEENRLHIENFKGPSVQPCTENEMECTSKEFNSSPNSHNESTSKGIKTVTNKEYETAPRFLKIQVSLRYLNTSIDALNEVLSKKEVLEMTEQTIEGALGTCGSRTKTIILSLVHLQRLTMTSNTGKKTYRVLSDSSKAKI